MNKGGRPRKATTADQLQKIVALMSEGASIVEVAAEIGVSRETIYQRCDPQSPYYDSEFSDTIKKGKELCEAWWMSTGRKALKAKDFNAALWYMNMKNRFGWSDSQKVEHTGAIAIEQITGVKVI